MATPLAALLCCLLASLLLLSSCKKDEPAQPIDLPQYGTTEGRVVVVYMAAENSLGSYSSTDLREMYSCAKYLGLNDHLIVYLDNTQLPRIYDFTYYSKDTPLDSIRPVRTYESDVNSCSTEAMSDVLAYVRRNYPSQSYGLVLWSHGSGWIPPVPSPYTGANNAWGAKLRSFGYDNGKNTLANTGGQLTINDIRDVLQQFGTLDFLLFDACFMQNIEVLYQLRHCARCIVGSPAEIPGPGAPYQSLVKPMFQDSAYVEGMVQAYYDYYQADNLYGVLLSAVDCAQLEHVAQVTQPYVKKYKQDLLYMDYTDVQDYFWWDSYFMNDYPDFYDMQGLMRAVLSAEEYPLWLAEYQKMFIAQVHTPTWYSAFNRSSNNKVDAQQYSGVSMHIPLYKYAMRDKWFAPAYYDTDWAKAVWIETEEEE